MVGIVREQRLLLIAIPAAVFVLTLLASPVLLADLPFGPNKWVATMVMNGR